MKMWRDKKRVGGGRYGGGAGLRLGDEASMGVMG